MTAPPWDRQFAAAGGLEALYPRLLAEFGRVLTPTGRMALLLNSAAFEARFWAGKKSVGAAFSRELQKGGDAL